MDILKKAVLLVAIVSIAVFMPGCGGDEAEDGGTEAQDAAGQAESSGGALDNLIEKIEEAQEEDGGTEAQEEKVEE